MSVSSDENDTCSTTSFSSSESTQFETQAMVEPLAESPGSSLLLNIKLGMWDFGQCDPKRCSGRKLARLGLVSILKPGTGSAGIILSPIATTYLSLADLKYITKKKERTRVRRSGTSTSFCGLAVIDCSWAQLDTVPFNRLPRFAKHRLLPPHLLATNSVNYGKPDKLNCAEAFIAGLALVGLWDEAQALAERVGNNYGQAFLDLNNRALKAYSQCQDEQQVLNMVSRLEKEGYSVDEAENNFDSEESHASSTISDE